MALVLRSALRQISRAAGRGVLRPVSRRTPAEASGAQTVLAAFGLRFSSTTAATMDDLVFRQVSEMCLDWRIYLFYCMTVLLCIVAAANGFDKCQNGKT